MTTVNATGKEGVLPTQPRDIRPSRLGQEDFMELMVTQIRNQDPFKPLESGEFLGQIAQFSTVSGIQDLQNSFAGVASALFSSQALQASSLIGRNVLINSDQVYHQPGNDSLGAVEVTAPVQALIVSVTDSQGQLVRQLNLGSQTAGMAMVDWDGLTDSGEAAGSGYYRLQAFEANGSGNRALKTYATGQVHSVTLADQGQGISLSVGRHGDVDFRNIKQIR